MVSRDSLPFDKWEWRTQLVPGFPSPTSSNNARTHLVRQAAALEVVAPLLVPLGTVAASREDDARLCRLLGAVAAVGAVAPLLPQRERHDSHVRERSGHGHGQERPGFRAGGPRADFGRGRQEEQGGERVAGHVFVWSLELTAPWKRGRWRDEINALLRVCLITASSLGKVALPLSRSRRRGSSSNRNATECRTQMPPHEWRTQKTHGRDTFVA